MSLNFQAKPLPVDSSLGLVTAPANAWALRALNLPDTFSRAPHPAVDSFPSAAGVDPLGARIPVDAHPDAVDVAR